jgi:hypothetical protein
VRRTERVLIEAGGDDVGHDGHRLLEMVECDDVAREREDRIGEPEVVLDRLREPLDLAHDVVAEVPDRAAMQRHARHRRCGEDPEERRERVEEPRILRDRYGRVAGELSLDGDAPCPAADHEQRVEPDERVPTPALAVLGRLEQEARTFTTHPVVDAERRVQVREDPAHDRDDTVRRAEPDERRSIRRDLEACGRDGVGAIAAHAVSPRWKQLREPVWQATPV